MNNRQSAQRWQLEDRLILIVGIALAVLLRFSLRDFESADFRNATGPWYDFIRANGGFQALRHNFTNYTPLYSYLLIAAVYLLPGLSKVFAIKLISIAFDFVCAFFVYKVVRIKYPNGSIPVFAFLAVLFAPTMVLNSALWGQADAIYTAGLVACLYFLMQKRESLAFLAFGLAFAVKLQALFLAPLLLILFLKGNVSWKGFLLVPGVYLLSILPVWLAGRPLPDLLTIYLQQAATYQELTLNAPNLYQWFPNELYAILYPAGMVWAAAVILLFCLSVYKSSARMTADRLIEVATLSVLIVPYFLPKMHDRYFFPADVLSLILAFFFPRYFIVPVIIGLVSFLSYWPFLFGFEVVPLQLLAVVQLVPMLILLRHLALQLVPDVN